MKDDMIMGNNLIEIKYLPLDNKSKSTLYNVFTELSMELGKRVSNYINTDIAGIYEDTLFTVYKDKEDNGKICVIFIGKNNQRIIYINSENNKNFLSDCNYYYELDTETNLSIETSGLKFMSRKYCKFEWEKNQKNYTIILSENPKDRSYRYEMILEDITGRTHVTCIWNNYQQFIKDEKPKEIILSDDMKCQFSNFTIINHNVYKSGDSEKTYEHINEMIESLGLSLDCSSPRRYISVGVSINGGLMEIVNKYLEYEQQISAQEEKILEEKEKEQKIEENRKEISINTNANPKKEENIFIELGNISKRHAIRKIDSRGDDIYIKQNKK